MAQASVSVQSEEQLSDSGEQSSESDDHESNDNETSQQSESSGCESESNDTASQQSDGDGCEKRASRKRLRKPEKWKKITRKHRRNAGKRYTSTSGNVVSCLRVLGIK